MENELITSDTLQVFCENNRFHNCKECKDKYPTIADVRFSDDAFTFQKNISIRLFCGNRVSAVIKN